jgi:hypothetical protein
MTSSNRVDLVRRVFAWRNLELAFVSGATVVPAVILGMIGYWWLINTFTTSSTWVDARIDGPDRVHPGDPVVVNFTVQRHRTCRLEIQRLIMRVETQQELQLQRVVISFVLDDPEDRKPFAANYKVEIDPSLHPGNYHLFNRTRYFCNPLDYISPRIVITNVVPITIVPRGEQ